jgi:hypothetical protein
MDILEVKFHLQNGWEGVDAFRSQMWAFGSFSTVQPLDVSVDMCFPSFSAEELLHPCGSCKHGIPWTEEAISKAGKGSAVDKRVALDWQRFRPP